jgi:hypothetical protein
VRAALWIDSSVARQPRVLRELTDLAKGRGVPVLVHAHVHLEMNRHLRTEKRDRYSHAMIREYFKGQRIQVSDMHLDEAAADRWAERLSQRYPTMADWEEAKKSTLGGTLRKEYVQEPGKMPMTTDWWVALQVEDAVEDRVAVDDQGGEWQSLRDAGRALDSEAAKQWLESLPVS